MRDSAAPRRMRWDILELLESRINDEDNTTTHVPRATP